MGWLVWVGMFGGCTAAACDEGEVELVIRLQCGVQDSLGTNRASSVQSCRGQPSCSFV